MSLEDEDGFTYGDLSVRRRPVALAVELRVVRLVLLEHVVDGCKEYPGNGDDCFLVSTAFLESKVAIADFWEFLGTNRIEGALNKQRFDVGSGPADSGGFLLPRTLVVLRRKTSQEHRCFAVGNTDISTPISEIMPIVAKNWIPGAVITRLS